MQAQEACPFCIFCTSFLSSIIRIEPFSVPEYTSSSVFLFTVDCSRAVFTKDNSKRKLFPFPFHPAKREKSSKNHDYKIHAFFYNFNIKNPRKRIFFDFFSSRSFFPLFSRFQKTGKSRFSSSYSKKQKRLFILKKRLILQLRRLCIWQQVPQSVCRIQCKSQIFSVL